ncbi:MAG: prepilin-type N-terminal cleavage/methylation domain-containing protein [Thermoproteota archaeon]
MARGAKGFTLLEVIIALLLATTMAIAVYPAYLKENRSKAVETFAQELNLALEASRRYFSVNGRFPSSWNDLINGGFIARVPVDPANRRNPPVLESNNTSTPRWMTITINGGIASTNAAGLGNIIISRVPFAYAIEGEEKIVIYQSEVQAYLDREVVYIGIHRHGDEITAYECRAGTNRYAVATPVSALTPDSAPLVGYRASLNYTSGSPGRYTVLCELKSSETNIVPSGANLDACWVLVMQVCH